MVRLMYGNLRNPLNKAAAMLRSKAGDSDAWWCNEVRWTSQVPFL